MSMIKFVMDGNPTQFKLLQFGVPGLSAYEVALTATPPFVGTKEAWLAQQSAAALIKMLAAASLGGHRAVIRTALGCDYADNTNPAHANKVIGLTSGAVTAGAMATITQGGLLNGFTGLTDALPIYLSTTGLITQVVPTSGFIQQLGIAISTTEAIINIHPALQL